MLGVFISPGDVGGGASHRLPHLRLSDGGIDLLVLRELMGHVSPETTAGYVIDRHVAASTAQVVIDDDRGRGTRAPTLIIRWMATPGSATRPVMPSRMRSSAAPSVPART
jgi:hypothetical protein